uniref:Uncharacterized protein n=1 Tax=Anguilla anguilla TaxID=7936 RepID=A0A0E9W9T3_ANGAN
MSFRLGPRCIDQTPLPDFHSCMWNRLKMKSRVIV